MKNFWEKLPKPFLALSPMCGVTDLPYRLICKKYGADVVYTEMIMVQALAHKGQKTMKLAEISKKEMPVVMQLGGKEPELFYKSAKIIAEDFRPAGIDINFGCPAKKVAGHGSGIALLRDLNLCQEIVQATMEGAGGLPVSIKTRSSIKSKACPERSRGDKSQTITSLDLLDKLKNLPVAAVMIHGRSFEAPWIEEVDYNYIKSVRDYYKGILIANGGIYEPEIAKKVLDITQADGLGIGHGVYGRPFIFNEIKEYLNKGNFTKIGWNQKKKIAFEHAKLAFKIKGERGLIELRKQLLWYVKGLQDAKKYRASLVHTKTLNDVKTALDSIS